MFKPIVAQIVMYTVQIKSGDMSTHTRNITVASSVS